MKKFIFLALCSLFLCSCFTPSRTEPSIKEYSTQFNGRVHVTSRTIFIPTPLPYKYEFGGAWKTRLDQFSAEQEMAAFSVAKDDKRISIRGLRKDFLYKDTSFTISKDVSDEEFVKYYLTWDLDYWMGKISQSDAGFGHGQNYTAGEAKYSAEKKYGTLERSVEKRKSCTLASVQDKDYFYIISGTTSTEDSDNMCKIIAEIWGRRAEF